MIRTCSNCGQKNRIPPRHLAHRGKCGSCGAFLEPLDQPLSVDEADFQSIVREARVPILVDFWAGWCAPCRMAAPHVQKVAAEMAGQALVLKVDTERNPRLAAEYQVSGIPNFAVLLDGKVRHQQAGLVDHRQMQRWLETYRPPST